MERLYSHPYWDTIPTQRFVKPLAILGGLYLATRLQSLASFTWTHFLRRGSLAKYKSKDVETWALVTGASDGIGKGFATELAHRGFEVILHGRNEKKLQGVQADLQRQFPARKFRLLILDADEDGTGSGKMVERLDEIKSLNIRVLINNVAGGGKHESPIFDSLHNRKAENVNGWLNISCRFPTQLTRLLLPTLISKPSSLILNIGSGVSEMSVPYLPVYSGCKAFNKVFSRSLQTELWADNNGHVEVIAIIVGQVATERMEVSASWATPSPRQMAISSLEAVGSGKKEIFAYWGHALQSQIFTFLPAFVFDTYGLTVARQMKADEHNGLKFKNR